MAQTRQDQAFRDRFRDTGVFDMDTVSAMENILAIPGDRLDCVIDVLHSGCVERVMPGDFGGRCFPEISTVVQQGWVGVSGSQFGGYVKNGKANFPLGDYSDVVKLLLDEGVDDRASDAARFWVLTQQHVNEKFDGDDSETIKQGITQRQVTPRPC